MICDWIKYFDAHEGTGTWLAAIGTFLAVATSLLLASLSMLRERRESRIRERNRLSVITTRFDVHGCLQVFIVFQAPGRESGWEARVKALAPSNAFLMEGVRRLETQGDRMWMETGIGKAAQLKQLTATLDWHAADPSEALRAVVFVTKGPGDDWVIGSAKLSISIYRVGGRVATTKMTAWVSPVGEHPREERLAGRKI